MKLESKCVKEQDVLSYNPSHILPIYATSSFVFDTLDESIAVFTKQKEGSSYSRYGNPTIDTVAKKIADLEAFGTGVEAWAYLSSSGMSAISTLMLAVLQTGDAILTQDNLYGGTSELFHNVLSKLGIQTYLFNHPEEIEPLIQQHSHIKMIYLETPTNPTIQCTDLEKVASLAKKYGKLTCVDNTFCTPLIQQPFLFGIDFIIHSTTKYLNGHGNSIAGAIIGKDADAKNKVWSMLKIGGATCNAFDAWLIHTGMKTLALRMQAHCLNATRLAHFLSQHPNVNFVNHPSLTEHPSHSIAKRQMKDFGAMLSFEVKGGEKELHSFFSKLSFCTHAPTLGDVDTLVLHPATSSHLSFSKEMRAKAGIPDNLVRVSVGIEHIDDIIEDFGQALA